MNAIVHLDTIDAVPLVPSSGRLARLASRRRLPVAVTTRTSRRASPSETRGDSGNPLLRAIAASELLTDEEQKRLLVAYRRAEDDIDGILAEAPRTASMIAELVPRLKTRRRLSEFFHMDKRPGSALRAGTGRDLATHYITMCQEYLRWHDTFSGVPGPRVPERLSRELRAAFTALNLALPLRESIIARIVADGEGDTCREARSLALVLRQAIRERDVARGRVETGNLRLVLSIARRMKAMAPTMELGDLVSEGMTGLRRAVQKFDPHLGNRFSTYAIWWIRQSISRAIDDRNALVRTTGTTVAGTGPKRDTPRPAEVLSLDEPMIGHEDRFLKDVIADTGTECAETGLARKQLRQAVRSVLAELPERERAIITARFGIGRPQMDIGKISEMVGVTRERIRQIERDVLLRLSTCARIVEMKSILA